MAEVPHIHDDIKLYTTAEKFYLEPTIHPTQVMILDRITGEASVSDINQVKIPIPPNAYKPICGFLGTIKLIGGLYLIAAKYRIVIGKINNQDIFELAGIELIPYARTTTHLTSSQVSDNEQYEAMVKAAFATPGIYFSYSYDLTHSTQRLYSVGPDFNESDLLGVLAQFTSLLCRPAVTLPDLKDIEELAALQTSFNCELKKTSMASRADPRFLWNGYLLRDFTDPQFSRFTLPLIQGFVSINRVTINGRELTWAIVSRRSVDRAGTRHFMRGVDAQGNVANYVETEQLIETTGQKASYVQTRGSIPLFWSQYPNIKYKPAVMLAQEDHVAAYTKHMRDQLQRYGNQVLINLIDQHGKEEALERGFRAAVAAAALPGVRYEPFDFHAECKGMRYDRLNVLIDRISHEQEEFGYFQAHGGSIMQQQSGTFRTNCIDCLDRTNVVQSLLARRQLDNALRKLEVIQPHETNKMESLFNNVWADHADMISVQYSGTGALKTDFTRTGKRTYMGMMRDGFNSLTRYYKNNFADGYRQDAIDLILGKYTVKDNEGNTVPCPLRVKHDWKYYTFPSVLVLAMSMFTWNALFPEFYDQEALKRVMLWGSLMVLTLCAIHRYGKIFVDWPRLDAGGFAATRAVEQSRL